jgi:tight adherence protein B
MLLYLAAVIIFVTLSGWALTAALFDTRRRRLAVERRMSLVTTLQPLDTALASQWPDRFVQFDSRIRNSFAFHMPFRWGMTSGALVLLSIGMVVAVAAWVLLAYGFRLAPAFALPVTLASFIATPRMFLRRQQRRAEKQFLTLFPDTVDMMVRMLRAGLPITSAIRSVGDEAQHPVDTLFSGLANQIAIGIDFDEVLSLASERIGGADFRFFTAAVALQRSTGGNLAATLEMLAEIIRRRRAARLKAHAVTAEARLSAIVLGVMPFVVTGLLLVLNPHYLAPLIGDPRGKIIIAMAIGLLTLGFLSMRQLMRSIESL